MHAEVSYTQGDEERHILQACQDSGGRFLDIGAWNPTEFSNTRALYERGWSGVLIEPSPEPFLKLLAEYGESGRVDLILAAVGLENGLLKIHASADGVSTSEEANFERWKGAAKWQGQYLIPTLTLAQIQNQFGGFDMISIDTEGTSVDLFKQMLALGWCPRCYVVEHDGRQVETARAAQSGYVRTYANENNEIWVRR